MLGLLNELVSECFTWNTPCQRRDPSGTACDPAAAYSKPAKRVRGTESSTVWATGGPYELHAPLSCSRAGNRHVSRGTSGHAKSEDSLAGPGERRGSECFTWNTRAVAEATREVRGKLATFHVEHQAVRAEEPGSRSAMSRLRVFHVEHSAPRPRRSLRGARRLPGSARSLTRRPLGARGCRRPDGLGGTRSIRGYRGNSD